MIDVTEALRDGWMTTEQAAAYLGKSTMWLRNNAKQLGIPRVKLGQQFRYRASEIDRWLREGLGDRGRS